MTRSCVQESETNDDMVYISSYHCGDFVMKAHVTLFGKPSLAYFSPTWGMNFDASSSSASSLTFYRSAASTLLSSAPSSTTPFILVS